MGGLHRLGGIGPINENGNLDLAGGDHADVDPLARQRQEHLSSHPLFPRHADADDRHLRHRIVVRHACGAEFLGDGPGDVERLGEIVGRDGKGDVGESLLGEILHDHVDGDPRGGQRREQLVVAPWLIGHPFERDPGLVLG